jgi:hypothetical protein
MRKELITLVAITALVVVGIVWVSPKATVTANEASTGIDTLDLTKKAKDLPIEYYPAH